MLEDVDILKDVVDVIVIDVLQDVDVIVKTFIGWRTTFPRDETSYYIAESRQTECRLQEE